MTPEQGRRKFDRTAQAVERVKALAEGRAQDAANEQEADEADFAAVRARAAGLVVTVLRRALAIYIHTGADPLVDCHGRAAYARAASELTDALLAVVRIEAEERAAERPEFFEVTEADEAAIARGVRQLRERGHLEAPGAR